MKKMIVIVLLFINIAISGCATDQGSTGGYEKPSGHEGHHH